MGTLRTQLTRYALTACSLSAVLVCLSAQAADNGEIVITRQVYPHAVGSIPAPPDPNPTVVNANPAAQINAMTAQGELGDGDFARISTGSSITRTITTGTHNLPGMIDHTGMPGLTSSGRAGGSGGPSANLGGQINRSIEQGMRPLTTLGGGQ
ncbi:hypothetical protein [Pseudomonas weihenstephanensis]|uniref:Fap n=1 Tax=Pseudomonas weihenstephanensis TaxID=1608994 RepID=A0A0J6IF26_9PSED|nr:hypothetical protein [Pseudomonas weihenstephanensis]KMN13230.1 hypothetical protein TU86_14270 [Pseudomonas weihenstephanensis]KMN17848.1 hypothetical protein TU87_14965 [Pseudomonas weihenstephanensis]MBM1191652.1 hypothetical protein [Pseudomonas weihenstephanensis]